MPSSMEKAAFLAKLKTASFGDRVKGGVRAAIFAVKSNPSAVVGGALGAALGGTAAYKLSKPGKDGLSTDQKLTRRALEVQEDADRNRLEPANLRQDMQGVGARTAKDVADVFAKHPRSAALTGAAALAPVGARVLPKLLKLVKR